MKETVTEVSVNWIGAKQVRGLNVRGSRQSGHQLGISDCRDCSAGGYPTTIMPYGRMLYYKEMCAGPKYSGFSKL